MVMHRMVLLQKILLNIAVRMMVGMIHFDGLFFRLVACNGWIYHAENHGDV